MVLSIKSVQQTLWGIFFLLFELLIVSYIDSCASPDLSLLPVREHGLENTVTPSKALLISFTLMRGYSNPRLIWTRVQLEKFFKFQNLSIHVYKIGMVVDVVSSTVSHKQVDCEQGLAKCSSLANREKHSSVGPNYLSHSYHIPLGTKVPFELLQQLKQGFPPLYTPRSSQPPWLKPNSCLNNGWPQGRRGPGSQAAWLVDLRALKSQVE